MRKKITKSMAVFFLMAAVLAGCGSKESEEIPAISTVEYNEIATEETKTEENQQPEETAQPEESTQVEEVTQTEVTQTEVTQTEATIQDEETPLAEAPKQENGADRQEATPLHEHSYIETILTQASCSAAGVKSYLCACGDSYTEAIAQVAHVESDWIVTVNATSTAKGSRHKVCANCGLELAVEEISAVGSDNKSKTNSTSQSSNSGSSNSGSNNNESNNNGKDNGGNNNSGNNNSGNTDEKEETKPIRSVHIELEEYSADEDGIGGTVTTEACAEGGEQLCGINTYGYTKYNDVDFGTTGFKTAIFRAATPMDGGDIEIRVDALEGEKSKLIGTCKITKTGDWSVFETFGCDLTGKVTGKHDVYIVFKGKDYLFNLNWCEFYENNTNKVTSVSLTKDAVTVGDILQPVIVPEDATVRYEWYVDGVLTATGSTYKVSTMNVGKAIQLKVKGFGSYSGTTESNKTQNVLAKSYDLDFDKMAYDSFTSFINKYYSVKDGVGKIKANYFWDFAEMYEIVIDAYVHSGEERYKNMIDEGYRGFTASFGTDWEFNEYNDDVMWMTIACTRAYMATGKEEYLNTAVKNFDMVYDRAWSEDLGGGVWWKTDKQSKNACVNCPAAIAACLLGEATGKEAYFEKAKAMLDWVVDNIYQEETGRVYDNLSIDGTRYDWEFTYNQGTFVGAATLLYEHYNDNKYFKLASKACDYTINTMYQGGIVNNEAGSSEEQYDDSQGFKGIMTRWFYLFAVNHNQPKVMDWLRMNAATAWENRNADGIMWTKWNETTSDNKNYSSFGASTAVALLQNVTKSGSLVKNGLQDIQVEDFNTCRGVVLSNDKKSLGSIQDGYYTIYQNVDFGSKGAIRAKFTAASALNGGKIEIRLDNQKGKLLGTAEISNTGSFSNWKEFVCEIDSTTGVKDICLVFKGEGFLFNIDKFSFSEEELEISDSTTDSDTDPAGKTAYTRIEMESYDEKADSVGTEDSASEGSTVLAGIQNGAYSVYETIDFGTKGAQKVSIRASAWDGGVVEIRDGAVDGELLASVEIASTGDWNNFKTFSADITSEIIGEHDLYLVFVGDGALYNLNWFEFYEKDKKTVTGVTINEGTIHAGDVIKAVLEPADATVNYEWYVNGEFKGYNTTYTTTTKDIGKKIRLKVTGYGDYVGSYESNTTSKVVPVSTTAYGKFEMEDFDEKGGNCGTDGTQLNGISKYGYAVYKNLDFGENGPKTFLVRAATPMPGGTIEIRVDALEGEESKLIGTCNITNTGDWAAWKEFACELSSVTGVHDVYMVFRGDDYLFNLDWFEFSDEEEQELVSVSITEGEVQVGDTLKAEIEPEDASVNYEWLVNGEVKGSGSTYTVQFSDAGSTIKLKISGIGNYKGTLESNTTSEVKAVKVDSVSAYAKIEAESYNESSGTGTEGCGDEGGGNHLAGINTYGYAMYASVDFGEDSPVSADFRAASDANGGKIKIYLDAKEGNDSKLIGTCEVTPTGGWGNWQDFSCELDAEDVTGTHTVYLVFEGDGYLYNFNWFRFNK